MQRVEGGRRFEDVFFLLGLVLVAAFLILLAAFLATLAGEFANSVWYVHGFLAIRAGAVAAAVFLLLRWALKKRRLGAFIAASVGIVCWGLLFRQIGVRWNDIAWHGVLFVALAVAVDAILRRDPLLRITTSENGSRRRLFKIALVVWLFTFLPLMSVHSYFRPQRIVRDHGVRVIADVTVPHSGVLADGGTRIAVTCDQEVDLIDPEGDDFYSIDTQRFGESQHLAVGMDGTTLFLVPRSFDAIYSLDTTRRRPVFEPFREIFGDRAQGVEFLNGTPWPVATPDSLIVVSEEGYIASCPMDADRACHFIHVAESNVEGVPSVVEATGAEVGDMTGTFDAVEIDASFKTLYVALSKPPYGVLVFDAKPLAFREILFAGHRIEYVRICDNVLYCSDPLRGRIAAVDLSGESPVRWMDAFFGVNGIACDSSGDRMFASSFFSPFLYEGNRRCGGFHRRWRAARVVKGIFFDPACRCLLATARDSNEFLRIDP